jgi:hypothetical protein
VQAWAFESALQWVQERHEILRTVFPELDGAPAQRVRPEADAKLPFFDATEIAETERTATVDAAIWQFSRRKFNLAEEPPFRVALVRVASDDERIVLTAHHIICDAWSIGILFTELLAAYERVCGHHTAPIPELPIQYCDYAIWDREQLASGALREQINYWKGKLADAPRMLELPIDRSRSEQTAYSGRLHRFQFDERTSQALQRLAREEAATPFMVLLSVFVAMLARCTRQRDILIGTPF